MITINDLKNESRYTKLDEINHDNIVDFVKKYLFQRVTNLTIMYNSLTAFIVFIAIIAALHFEISLPNVFMALLASMVSIVIYIPVHEFIHGYMYKHFGAKDVRYHVNLKKLVFSTTAHEFVIGGKEFSLVAAMPFLVLTVVSIFFFILGGVYTVYGCFLFVMNLLVSGGDFALINYIFLRRKIRIFTYDDDLNKITYFYKVGVDEEKSKDEKEDEREAIDLVAELRSIAYGTSVKPKEPVEQVETEKAAKAEETAETEAEAR